MGRPKGERRGGKGRGGGGGGGGGGKGRGYPQDGESWRADGPRRCGEEAGRGQAGAGPRRPPPRTDGVAAAVEADVPRGLRAAQGLRDPMKPPAPTLPAGVLVEAKAAAEEPPRRPSASPERADGDGDWTPVDKLMEKPDRRTFFHTAGKSHTIGQAKTDGKKYGNPQEECEVGSIVVLQVDEVHFGQPRVGLRGEPEIMGKMIKWPADKFDEYTLECAQISFGTDYWVWSTATITSNRILYAMKRAGVRELRAQCVPAPPVPEPDEDVDLTYGASIQGIQLVP